MGYCQSCTETEVHEACGLACGYSDTPDPKLFGSTVTLAHGVKHRGAKGSGFHVHGRHGDYVHHSTEKFDEMIVEPDIDPRKTGGDNNYTILHCRYGTSSNYDPKHLQPQMHVANDGRSFSLSHNGDIPGIDELANRHGVTVPPDANDTAILGLLLAGSPHKNWDDRVVDTLDQIAGAYCVLIGAGNSVYAARGKLGIRPLAEGTRDGQRFIASESYAFDLLGVMPHEVLPGTILRIDPNGKTVIRPGQKVVRAGCGLEWAYFAHYQSLLYPTDMTNYQFRYRVGEEVARRVQPKRKRWSIVVPIPDSGRAFGHGFADASGIPKEELIVRNLEKPAGSERTFMRDDQRELIREKVLQKLLFLDSKLWQGASVWLADDSVIRGSVSGIVVEEVFKRGAAEVYLLSGFPPFLYRCYLGISTRSQDELIAHHHRRADGSVDIDAITTAIHPRLNGLFYVTVPEFLRARGFTDSQIGPESPTRVLGCDGCLGCISGEFPIFPDGRINPYYLNNYPELFH